MAAEGAVVEDLERSRVSQVAQVQVRPGVRGCPESRQVERAEPWCHQISCRSPRRSRHDAAGGARQAVRAGLVLLRAAQPGPRRARPGTRGRRQSLDVKRQTFVAPVVGIPVVLFSAFRPGSAAALGPQDHPPGRGGSSRSPTRSNEPAGHRAAGCTPSRSGGCEAGLGHPGGEANPTGLAALARRHAAKRSWVARPSVSRRDALLGVGLLQTSQRLGQISSSFAAPRVGRGPAGARSRPPGRCRPAARRQLERPHRRGAPGAAGRPADGLMHEEHGGLGGHDIAVQEPRREAAGPARARATRSRRRSPGRPAARLMRTVARQGRRVRVEPRPINGAEGAGDAVERQVARPWLGLSYVMKAPSAHAP